MRSLCVCELGLITASRDKTIKLWREVDGKYEVETTFVGHQSYVTAVAYIAPGLLPGLDNGAIVSGMPLACISEVRILLPNLEATDTYEATRGPPVEGAMEIGLLPLCMQALVITQSSCGVLQRVNAYRPCQVISTR